jgi:aldehyde:ferredoxin oxidoreductase
VGAHGIRSEADYTHGICYACSVQGGDHTSTVRDAYSDMLMVFADSAVYCAIIRWAAKLNRLDWRFLRAITGWNITEEKWKNELGHRIIHIQRAAELLGGPNVKWNMPESDDNPPRFYEPLPSGPYKGSVTDKNEIYQKRAQYYEAIGWDRQGIPKSEVLKRLDLNDVNKSLDRIRHP